MDTRADTARIARAAAAAVAVAALVLAVATARADEPPEPGETAADASSPGDAAGWLVVPRGVVAARVSVEVNAGVREMYEPVSVAPDVFYGVTDAITVGLVHGGYAEGVLSSGGGLCLRGADAGCPRRYDTVGIDYRHAVYRDGAVALAGHARVQARALAPLELALAAGAAATATAGRVTATADPHVALGLTNRDLGNRGYLNVPIWLRIRVAGGAALAVHTGLEGPLSGFGDEWAVPTAAGALYAWRTRGMAWEAGAYGGFSKLVGAFTNVRPRELVIYLAIARAP